MRKLSTEQMVELLALYKENPMYLPIKQLMTIGHFYGRCGHREEFETVSKLILERRKFKYRRLHHKDAQVLQQQL